MKTKLQQDTEKALQENNTTAGKLSAVLGVIDRHSPTPRNAGMVSALQTVLQYLEHPDVQALPFALPASAPARMVREMIADLQNEEAIETAAPALLAALKITASMLNWSWVRDAFVEHGYQAQYHTMQEQNRAAIAKAEKE